MVVDLETRAASVRGGKTARACDACTRGSRASWYCPADDAFLCQNCDASVHSANQLAKRHERVRLQSSSPSRAEKTTSVWYEGFRKKARTPRNKLLQIEDAMNYDLNFPLVPELGVEQEDHEDGFFSFSSTDENEESLSCCVPVFDPFSDDMMVIDDNNSVGLVPDGVKGGGEGDLEKAIMEDDDLIGFLPLDMDLAVLTMDVEGLLQEEQTCFGVKEEDDLGFEINHQALRRVKEEETKCENEGLRENDDGEESEDEDRRMSLLLKLDYDAVITAWGSHGSPWETGIKPELNSVECWAEGQLGGYTYPSNMISGFEESAIGSVTRKQGRGGGGSDGEREARVLRYKEKRRTRLFAKKIRYEVRKLNAEQRPRIKGRFVKRTSL